MAQPRGFRFDTGRVQSLGSHSQVRLKPLSACLMHSYSSSEPGATGNCVSTEQGTLRGSVGGERKGGRLNTPARTIFALAGTACRGPVFKSIRHGDGVGLNTPPFPRKTTGVSLGASIKKPGPVAGSLQVRAKPPLILRGQCALRFGVARL